MFLAILNFKKMEKVKVGIIGSGFAADLHAKAYQRCPYAELISVSAINNLKNFSKQHNIPTFYSDYRQMLAREDIQMVSVCIPNYLHKEAVIAAANAGKDIVCEKPLTTNLKDADEMVSTCNNKGVKLMYAEDWIFAPAIVRAKEVYREGAIGDILYIKAKETHSGSHSLYAQKLKYCGGGAMIHLGIHPVGFVLWLKGEKVNQVIAKTSKGKESNLLHTNFEGEDWAAGILTFEDETYALVEGNYITFGGMDDRIEIYGSKGNIKINLTQGSPISVYSPNGYTYAIEKADTTKGWTFPAVDEERSLGYQDEIAYFVNCVREDREIMRGVRGEDGWQALKVISAIYESSKSGRAVKLKENYQIQDERR